MSRQIATILSLKDRMSSPLVRVSKNVNKVTREMKKSQNQVTRWQKKSVRAMDKFINKSVKVGMAFGALAGAFAVKTGFEGLKELEEGSAKVKSIAKDALQLNDIKEGLLKASSKTGIGVAELADTQYNAISSGVASADSLQAALTAAKLAKAGFTDANSALKIMTATMNVYKLSGQEAMQSISNKLLITQNLGVTTVAELAESLGPLTPIADSAGASIDELMAGMAALTKNGIKTDEAVTAFKGILTSVISPTAETSKMAKKLGIDFSVSAIKAKGFGKFLEEIKAKTKGDTEAMGQLFGNVRALSGALVLSGKGLEDFNFALDAMKNSAGATDEAFAVMTNTIGHKWNKMKNTAKNILTSIMNTQSGAIGEYTDKFESWVEHNEKKIQQRVKSIGAGIAKVLKFIKDIFMFIKDHEKLITTILVFVGALYTVIKVIGILKTVLTALNTIWLILNGTLVITPLGWIVLAIGAVIAIGYALYRNWDMIKAKAIDLWDGIKKAFSPMGDFFIGLWEGVKSGFKSFVNFFIGGINKVVSGINSVKVKVPDWVPGFGGKEWGIHIPELPSYALGTSYFDGGLARINERGGEIVNLPNGSQVIPADKSKKIIEKYSNDSPIQIIIYGNVYGEDDLIDKIGRAVYSKTKKQLANVTP